MSKNEPYLIEAVIKMQYAIRAESKEEAIILAEPMLARDLKYLATDVDDLPMEAVADEINIISGQSAENLIDLLGLEEEVESIDDMMFRALQDEFADDYDEYYPEESRYGITNRD